jgi:diguanylate cyclase (GGDEF)-like protein/PAS domain S-box-containing protein
MLVVAAALFAAVTAWRFAATDPAAGVGFLYVIPVALVAVRFGLLGGLVAAATSTGLVMWWAFSTDALGFTGYATRSVTFVAVAAVVGWQVERRRALEGEADRWFSLSSDMCVVANLDGYFTRVNDAWTASLGYSEEELLERPFVAFVHPGDVEATNTEAAALADPEHLTVRFENRYRAKDGSWHWLQWVSRSDGRHIYAAARDVTEQKRLEADLRMLARSDDLTGLPNRRVWADRHAEEVRRARRSGAPLSVAMIDLDGFKQLNDGEGHAAGDRLLKAVAAEWSRKVRETDLLARLGGDEFGLLLPDCGTAGGIAIVERMRAAMPAGQTFSVGVATWNGEEPFEDAIKRADQRLYEDKKGKAAVRS